MGTVDLGFAEECESWKLNSRFFPSKIGGKPAWLDLKNIPSFEDLQCKLCQKQMIFLCQIYAPFEFCSLNFHRTLFIFVCRNPSCCKLNCSDNFKVFRSNLSLNNEFYPDKPAEERNDVDFPVTKWAKLCNLCGCKADKHCAKCGNTYYCSRHHQVYDWKTHKTTCGSDSQQSKNSDLLFPEFEIVLEDEEEIVEEEVDEETAMLAYEQYKKEGKLGTMLDIPDSELKSYVGDETPDDAFLKFVTRIKKEPEQILRYDCGKNPLFIAAEPLPGVIPDCEICSSPRQFECQIVPHLLVVLKEFELDWGTLIIYSCKNSCSDKVGYKQEYIFKQDVS